jgi:hypothetical protein
MMLKACVLLLRELLPMVGNVVHIFSVLALYIDAEFEACVITAAA